MKLALFDLDNTLLPLDSDHGWANFLIELGVLNKTVYAEKNDRFYADYQAGTLDIQAFLAFQLQPLAAHSISQLHAWREQYLQQHIEPNIKPAALELLAHHKNKGHTCAIVTATNSFITAPIAKRFGVELLFATEPELNNGEYTGKVVGVPCFREGKVTRLTEWLHAQQLDWSQLQESHFYSDSINDLPLLEQVTHPVAANPDNRLHDIAKARNWPILQLFNTLHS